MKGQRARYHLSCNPLTRHRTHCNSAPPEGLTEDGGRGGWSYTRINSADGNAGEGGAAGSVKPSWILGRVGVRRKGRGILRFTAPKHQCPHLTPVQEPRSPGTAVAARFAEQDDGRGREQTGLCPGGGRPIRRSDRGWCRSPALTLCSERQPRDPRLRHSSVSLESGNKMMGQGTLRRLQSKIFPCYQQLALPGKTPAPVSAGAQKERSPDQEHISNC